MAEGEKAQRTYNRVIGLSQKTGGNQKEMCQENSGRSAHVLFRWEVILLRERCGEEA